MDFKTAIEKLRRQKIQLKFPNENNDWINKFWFKSGIEYKKGRSAAQIEKNIIEFIKLCGFHAEKHSVVGREVTGKDVRTPLGTIKGKKSYIPSQSQIGSADVTSTIYGVSLKIEVKKGRDRMSPEQIKYQKEIEAAGGFYFIAHHEEDFFDKFIEFMKEPKVLAMKEFHPRG